jgi:two-component system sensor histidine kinase GlrK
MSFAKLFSLRNFIFIGFAVAVIPLFVAVLYAVLAIRETASLGNSLNRQVFDQTKTIRLVLQKTADIERKARLFVLLSDPALRQPDERQSYDNTRAAFKQAVDGLLKLNLDNTIALRANELAAKERLIYEQIIGAETENMPKLPIDEAFQSLREASNILSREFERHVEQQFAGLHQQSASLERGLLVKGTVLLLVSVGFMAGLLVMLTRSIRQLDAAIRTLGSGNRIDPITVSGPCDLRELGERLDWLRTRLLELEAAKYRLMETVAGEIEKPLEAIVELAARLAEDVGGDFDPQRLDTALQLSANVESLQTVSAQLLRFSQINPASQGFSKEPVNMKALLEAVIEDYQTRFHAKSLTVKALLRPVAVSGIAEQLHAVVDHLLSNAVKFSPDGGEIRVLFRHSAPPIQNWHIRPHSVRRAG